MKRFMDKTVLVTGGGRGIGLAVAENFAKEGAKVCIGDLNLEQAKKSAEMIKENYNTECVATTWM